MRCGPAPCPFLSSTNANQPLSARRTSLLLAIDQRSAQRLVMWGSQFHIARHLKQTRLRVIQTYIQTYIHTYRHTYIQTYIHTYIHAYTHTYTHTHIHAYIHTYIHACIHTYIQTYIHTYIHRYVPLQIICKYIVRSIWTPVL